MKINDYVKTLLTPFLLLFCLLMLSACQSKPQGLTAEQIAVLKQQGFSLTSEGWELGLNAKVLFGNNQDTLSPQSQKTLETLSRELIRVGLVKVNLDGYTDDYGDDKYNEDLSLRRANTVATAFSNAGMPRANIHTRGMGKRNPVASNKTQVGRAENRRVTVIIVV